MAETQAAADAPVFEIPKTCKAGVVVNEGPDFKVVVEDVPVPEPGPDEVLVRLNITGLCYSDIHYMLGDLGLPTMASQGVRSPGHEGAGVVVKVGSNVKNVKVGDRGGIKPMWDVCERCGLCWSGDETHCPKSVSTGLQVAGTYQQYITSPAKYLSPIPDGVPDEIAAPIMCSASTIYRSLKEANLAPGNWAVFPGGGGGVGIQGVQLAKAMGYRAIAIDTGAAKQDLCLSMGATHFIDFKEAENVAAKVIELTEGIGAHAVIVTAPAAYKDAVLFTGRRVRSKVLCIGLPPAGSPILGAQPAEYIFKNMAITGTLVGSMHDTQRALEFAQQGQLKPVYEKYPIARLPEAVERLRRGEAVGRCIVDFNM